MCLRRLSNTVSNVVAATREKPSPSDILPRSALTQVDGNLVVDLTQLVIPFTRAPVVWTPRIPDTGSMDPAFDAGNNNFLIAGDGDDEMEVLRIWLELQPAGNVVVYRRTSDGKLIIHRIVKVGRDDQGVKYTLRGDNNGRDDRQVVRGADILYLSIGTIY